MKARREWRARAACRSVDPELFFPTAETGPVHDAQVTAAKAVCAVCPVRVECLDEALMRIPEGIAGGLTPQERRRLRRPGQPTLAARAKARCGQREAAGRVLLAAGRPIREVARRCGVTERTAARWAARVRALTTTSTGRGSLAATGLPSGPPTRATPSQGLERRKDTDSR